MKTKSVKRRSQPTGHSHKVALRCIRCEHGYNQTVDCPDASWPKAECHAVEVAAREFVCFRCKSRQQEAARLALKSQI